MAVTKTNFINYSRCRRYVALAEVEKSKLNADISYEDYQNEELENELKELESKLREVNKLLKIDEKGENVIEDFEDEEQEEKSQDYDKEPIR